MVSTRGRHPAASPEASGTSPPSAQKSTPRTRKRRRSPAPQHEGVTSQSKRQKALEATTHTKGDNDTPSRFHQSGDSNQLQHQSRDADKVHAEQDQSAAQLASQLAHELSQPRNNGDPPQLVDYDTLSDVAYSPQDAGQLDLVDAVGLFPQGARLQVKTQSLPILDNLVFHIP